MNKPTGKIDPCLSVIIPFFNEESTIEKIVDRVIEQAIVREIIMVDDCSRDNSFSIAQKLADKYPMICLYHHDKNSGKGSAIQTGIKYCTSPFVIIQDADLEYDPREYELLLQPLLLDQADVVYGSRYLPSTYRMVPRFWHTFVNKSLTQICNMISDLSLTDMETCYKVFRRDQIQSLVLCEKRFGFEPEVTIKIARKGWRVYEVGISYSARKFEQGKKIRAKDGFSALWCILKYRFTRIS